MNDHWVSVKDRLPNHNDKSIHCILENGTQHIAHYIDDIDEWIVGGWENCYYCGGRSKVRFARMGDKTENHNIEFATFWMPLPKPPKVSEQERLYSDQSNDL